MGDINSDGTHVLAVKIGTEDTLPASTEFKL